MKKLATTSGASLLLKEMIPPILLTLVALAGIGISGPLPAEGELHTVRDKYFWKEILYSKVQDPGDNRVPRQGLLFMYYLGVGIYLPTPSYKRKST